MTKMPSRYQSSPHFHQNYHSPLEVGRCEFDHLWLAPRLRKQRYTTWHLKRSAQKIPLILTSSRENRAVSPFSRVCRSGSDLISFFSPRYIFMWTKVWERGNQIRLDIFSLTGSTYSLPRYGEPLPMKSCDCSLKVEPSQNLALLVLFLQWFQR